MGLCPRMGVRKVQLEYCCKSKLFAPSDDNLTVQKYKQFYIPQGFCRKNVFFPKKNGHVTLSAFIPNHFYQDYNLDTMSEDFL